MGAFTYPRSEPGSAGHMDLIERLNAFPSALRREVASQSESVLSYRPSEGGWSIKEIVGHLRDHAQFLCKRLSMIIDLEEPRLEAYDEEALVRERNPQAAIFSELVAEFTSLRAETVDMLSGLVHWNWSRTGRHAEFGRMSVRQIVDRALLHDEAHLEQIRSLKGEAQRAALRS